MINNQDDSVYQLHIFSKNTDAQAGIRGFEYQKLKTLASWVNTYQKPESQIYCEYEDDIMEVSPAEASVTFRQIKMYSSKFSLNSLEVKKSIANFFMLYCNKAYTGQRVQFIFETNSSVTPSEAILQEWVAHQDQLTDDILTRCKNAVNAILLEYIKQETKAFIERANRKIQTKQKKLDNSTEEIQKASYQLAIEQLQEQITDLTKVADSYSQLGDSVLTDFVQNIRWEFLSLTPDQAFIEVIEHIQDQLLRLPYGILSNETDALIARLHWFVSQTSMQDDPADRLLTFHHLEDIILSREENDDKWYADIREQWQQESIRYFLVAEFYEVVNVSHHCRSKTYLYNDTELWVQILEYYYSLAETPRFAQRKAAYEICTLIIKIDSVAQGRIPRTFLGERTTYIYDYFSDIEAYTNIRDIEDAISLLSVVYWEVSNPATSLSEKNWRDWTNRLNALLDERLVTENPNYRCGLLECKANLTFTTDLIEDIDKACQHVIGYLNKIIELLSEAPFYSVYQLQERLSLQIQLLTDRLPDKLLDELIELSERLSEFVGAREGDFKRAKNYVEQGVGFLESNKLVRSLNSFHKAKDLWYKEEAADGFILACLNIAQLYSALGMNLAAKQYAISAGWFAGNTNDPELMKRYAHAFFLAAHADYKQGAWISFLDCYDTFVQAAVEFDLDAFKNDEGELSKTGKMMTNSLSVEYIVQRFAPELNYLVQHKLRSNTSLDRILPVNEAKAAMSEQLDLFNDADLLMSICKNKIDDEPLNDLGPVRTIRWFSDGSEWLIRFANDWHTTPVAEQVAAILQILQIELISEDLHLIRAKIEIDLSVKDEGTMVGFELAESNERIHWTVRVPTFTSINDKDSKAIKFLHVQVVTMAYFLIRNISLLPKTSKEHILEERLKKYGLSEKTLTVQPYEKLYRQLFNQTTFEETKRSAFTKPVLYTDFKAKELEEMHWKASISPLYNHKQTLEYIKNRYENFDKLWSRTVRGWMADKRAQQLVTELKQEGHLDWHILLAMKHIVLNYRADFIVRQQGSFASSEAYRAAFMDVFNNIRSEGENDPYISIPVETILSDEFHFFMNQVPVWVLESYGLENESRTPHFSAILNFLKHRFNFQADDVDHTPLS
ncbi:hypothetical protein A6C57_28060 (plasmid) [Fibrella sp. ES10-3-2-2]